MAEFRPRAESEDMTSYLQAKGTAQPGTVNMGTPGPINTSQPNPATVNATPITNAAPTAPAPLATPTPAPVTPAPNTSPGQVQGTLPGQTASTTFTSPEVMKQYGATEIKQGLAAAQASGPAPQDSGPARSAVSTFTPPSPPNTSGIDAQLAQDKGYQQLQADYEEYNNTINQGTSLVDEYNKLNKSSGLEAIKTELINSKAIIDGTEDDIRNEVMAVSGFASESQVQALASARNKSLIKNYNKLVDQQSNLTNHLNTMVNLKSQDRSFALQSVQQKMQITEQINNYRDKFVQNAKEGYKNIIAAIGYNGLFSSLANDPKALALAERTMGLGAGKLAELSDTIKAQTNLKTFKDYNISTPYIINNAGEVQDTGTGEGYKDPADFQAKTGMTLQQAGAKGMIKPLGMTRDQIKDERGYGLDLAKFGLDQDKFGLDTYKTEAEVAKIYNEIGKDSSTAPLSIDNIKKLKDMGYEVPLNATKAEADNLIANQIQTKKENIVIDLTSKVDEFKNLSNHSGISGAVGVNKFGRFLGKTFGKAGGLSAYDKDFIGRIQAVTSGETLDKVIQFKQAAGGVGSLSDRDVQMMREAATAINAWSRRDKDGNVTHYEIDQGSFKRELNKLEGATQRLMEQAAGLKKSDLDDMDDVVGFNQVGKTVASKTFNQTFSGSQKYYGSPLWSKGLDYVAPRGTEIPAFAGGKVIEAGQKSGWGNTVVVDLGSGLTARFSHLDKIGVSKGQTINSQMVIGTIGNSGNVLKSDGGKPTAKELAAGRGSHLDLTIYKNGKALSATQVDKLMKSLG